MAAAEARRKQEAEAQRKKLEEKNRLEAEALKKRMEEKKMAERLAESKKEAEVRKWKSRLVCVWGVSFFIFSFFLF